MLLLELLSEMLTGLCPARISLGPRGEKEPRKWEGLTHGLSVLRPARRALGALDWSFRSQTLRVIVTLSNALPCLGFSHPLCKPVGKGGQSLVPNGS